MRKLVNANPCTHQAISPRGKQQGVALMESLVALVVLALGVMGLLGLQLRTMVNNQNASHTASAARLADALFEAVKSNPNASPSLNPAFTVNAPLNPAQWAWLGAYTHGWNVLPPAGANCNGGVLCNAGQKAAWDVNQWKQSVRQNLPNGEAAVLLGSIPQQLVVVVGWRANEQAGVANPSAVNLPGGLVAPAACGTTHTCYFAYGQP